MNGNALLEPVPAKSDLDPIEFRVLGTQVRIRNVPPAAGDFQGLRTSSCYQNSSAGAGDEVEGGGISPREVDAGVSSSSAQLDEGRDSCVMGARVPAEDEGVEGSTGNLLGSGLHEHRNEVGGVFEAAAAPAAANLTGQLTADENSRSNDLCFREGVGSFFAGCARCPDAEVPGAILNLGIGLCLSNCYDCPGDERNQNEGVEPQRS